MQSGTWITLALVVVIYPLPTLIAVYRHASSTAAIAVLNLLLGWTLVMWFGASMWALVDKRHVR